MTTHYRTSAPFHRIFIVSILLPFALNLFALNASSLNEGFSLASPGRVASLAKTPDSPARQALIHNADFQLSWQPHPMAHVHTEGTLQHQGIRDQSEEAERDFPIAANLALAGRITGDQRYTKAAAKIVAAWISIYQPNFNPIDETIFDRLFIAYDLLTSEAKAPLRSQMQSFFRTLANGYFENMKTLSGSKATNNWQSHRIKLVTMAAFELADPELIKKAQDAYAKQLQDNLRPDGPNIDFEERDAIHYVVYDLEPLEMAALVAKEHGKDWYHMTAPSGATVGKTIDWLAPYAEGTKIHEEFVHSKVKFDYMRRDAGQAGFSGPFDPKNARETIALAARLDTKYVPLAKKMGEHDLLYALLFPLKDEAIRETKKR